MFNVILAHQINAVLPPQLDVIAAQYNISDSTMDYVVSAVLGGRPSLTLYPVKDELPPGSPQYDATVAAMQEATVIAFKWVFFVIRRSSSLANGTLRSTGIFSWQSAVSP